MYFRCALALELFSFYGMPLPALLMYCAIGFAKFFPSACMRRNFRRGETFPFKVLCIFLGYEKFAISSLRTLICSSVVEPDMVCGVDD